MPFVIGLVVVAIGFAFGANAGYAINPARDFGPRLASWLTGYETAWQDVTGTQYWWVPVVAPVLGALVGAGLYELLIGRSLPLDEQEVGEVIVDPHGHAEVTARLDAVLAHMDLVPAPVPPASLEPIRSTRDV